MLLGFPLVYYFRIMFEVFTRVSITEVLTSWNTYDNHFLLIQNKLFFEVLPTSQLGGRRGRSGQLQKISPASGFETRTVQPVASCYTVYAIPKRNCRRKGYIYIYIYLHITIVINFLIYQIIKYIICFPMKGFISQETNVNLTNFKISNNMT